jgi:putative thioredoxin
MSVGAPARLAPYAAEPGCPADARKADFNFTLKDLEGRSVKLSDYKGKVVLLDFWATWCGPCRKLSPTLERIVAELDGRMVLAKVDIDQNAQLADAFGIQSVPTVVLLVGGKIVDGFVGAQEEDKIRELIAKHVPSVMKDELADALAFEKADDPRTAIEALRQLLTKSPTRNDVRAHLARMLLAAGMTEEGQRIYATLPPEALELEPAQAAKLLIDLAQSRVDTAPLKKAVEANPDDVSAESARASSKSRSARVWTMPGSRRSATARACAKSPRAASA